MSKEPAATRAPRPAAAIPLAPAPAPPPRPGCIDYLLILGGCALSLVLTDLSSYRARPTAETPAAFADLALKSLPHMLFLPLGVLLLWPLFFLKQKLAGRTLPLSPAEWLWGVAWLGVVALTVWIAWQHWGPGTLPDFLRPDTFKGPAFVGYALAMLALAAVGLLIGVVDLIGRWPRPWTHSFCLALLMWPALPLLLLLLWNVELK